MNRSDIEPAATVRRLDTLLFTRVDAEFLAIDAKRGECFSLNETAKHIWDCLQQPTTLAGLCERLTTEYAVPAQTCEQDVVELLDGLRAAGLVEISRDG